MRKRAIKVLPYRSNETQLRYIPKGPDSREWLGYWGYALPGERRVD